MDVFQRVSVSMRILLDPIHLKDIRGGVAQKFAELLLKYQPSLQGTVICFENIQIPKNASVFCGEPELNFRATSDLIVFSPKVGSILDGCVNQVGFDHIGVLVYGVFNVTIPASNIPDSYVRDTEEDKWYNPSDPDDVLAAGSSVTFQVAQVTVVDRVLSLVGTLSIDPAAEPPSSQPLEEPSPAVAAVVVKKCKEASGAKKAKTASPVKKEKQKKKSVK